MKPTIPVMNKASVLLTQLEDISGDLGKKSYMEAASPDYRKLARDVMDDASILKNIGQYFGYCQNRILKRVAKDMPAYRSALGEIMKK